MTYLEAASSSVILGPPKGQPVPVFISIPRSRRFPSLMVCFKISIQAGERKSINFFSKPLVPYIGVISTPPSPAFDISSRRYVRLSLSTALPNHHQRVQGLVSLVIGGHAKSVFVVCACMVNKINTRKTMLKSCFIFQFYKRYFKPFFNSSGLSVVCVSNPLVFCFSKIERIFASDKFCLGLKDVEFMYVFKLYNN